MCYIEVYMIKVLIADDDADFCSAMKIGLTINGFEVITAADGGAAWATILQQRPQVVLLDYSMPVIDGRELCKKTRTNTVTSETIIIMLTARSEDMDVIACYAAGADDYCIKPFKLLHLVMRINALCSRLAKPEAKPELIIDWHGLSINYADNFVALDGVSIILKQKEFLLLYYLFTHANRIVSRDELLNNVWGYEFCGDTRTVDTHISNLRDKLSGCADFIAALTTVRGSGYRLVL